MKFDASQLATTLATLESELLFALAAPVFGGRFLLASVRVFQNALPEALTETVEQLIALFQFESVFVLAKEINQLESHVVQFLKVSAFNQALFNRFAKKVNRITIKSS